MQSTHTPAIFGNIQDSFTAEMNIRMTGTNYVLAHVKLGRVQLAIQEIVMVHRKSANIMIACTHSIHSDLMH